MPLSHFDEYNHDRHKLKDGTMQPSIAKFLWKRWNFTKDNDLQGRI